jgi:hypothetical protein
MIRIYSKVKKDKLLHIISRTFDLDYPNPSSGREDVVPENQFLQVARCSFDEGKTFKAHKHIRAEKTADQVGITQESWVVLSGRVRVFLYDLDDTLFFTTILEQGDCSITLEGGHNYEMIEDSRIMEFKTGPYLGVEKDKVLL